jgi:K+-transporting ATPase A subunit
MKLAKSILVSPVRVGIPFTQIFIAGGTCDSLGKSTAKRYSFSPFGKICPFKLVVLFQVMKIIFL